MKHGVRSRPLRIGVTCYPSTGGSGIIATEIGLQLSRRGHDVHFICHDVPARLGPHLHEVEFHRVAVRDYPLHHMGPYPLALASKMADVSAAADLDLLHVHYAVPHATSALLARQILAQLGQPPPRVVTTLHGTDVTLVGSDPSLQPVIRMSLMACDALTAPSAYLQKAAYDHLLLPEHVPIEVIPNFVDTDHFRPAPPLTRRFGDAPVLIHSSNFRALKRIEDAVQVLWDVRAELPAVLVLVGDGPERPRVEALVRELGLSEAVIFLGMRLDFVDALQHSDVFLLPSATEGFGLAALEALSCGVPVVASRVGGVPEVVLDGETGYLCAPGDVSAMTAAVLHLLRSPALHRRMSAAARALVERVYQREPLVRRYEDLYLRVLDV